MKKIVYTIEYNTVWENVLDTKLKLVLNFRGIYKGTSKKDCLKWLKSNQKKLTRI